MKLTLIFAVFILSSVTNAWVHKKHPLGDVDIWKIFEKLFPPVRPIEPHVTTPENPVIVIETVQPQLLTTQKPPEITTDHNVVTETVVPNTPATSIQTEPTPKEQGTEELKLEVLRTIAKITDILIILPKPVLTIVSVILPILGGLIDIISVYLNTKTL